MTLVLAVLLAANLTAIADHAESARSVLHGVDLAPATAPSEAFNRPPSSPEPPEPPAVVLTAMPAAPHIVPPPTHAASLAPKRKPSVSAKPRPRPAMAAARPGKWISPWRRAFIARWGHEPPVPAPAPGAARSYPVPRKGK